MRYVLLITLILTWSLLAYWHLRSDVNVHDFLFENADDVESGEDFADVTDRSKAPDSILNLQRYDDADYGFSVAIPDGWTRIVAADNPVSDDDDLLALLEPGYAVGFESPRAGLKDRFADYILIEVLPGDDIGLFETSEDQRYFIRSGSDEIAYERLEIDGDTDDASEVDLVIFQHGVQAVGYTLAFYAIGEPANEKILFDAFQILLRTYTQKSDPFVII
ncbi:MAG: hypothetical protein AB8B64_17560 [Granulosicoccus sp.]